MLKCSLMNKLRRHAEASSSILLISLWGLVLTYSLAEGRDILAPQPAPAAQELIDEEDFPLRDAATSPPHDTAAVEVLFSQGVDFYLQREFDKSRAMFAAVLAIDGENIEARNALRRLALELP